MMTELINQLIYLQTILNSVRDNLDRGHKADVNVDHLERLQAFIEGEMKVIIAELAADLH